MEDNNREIINGANPSIIWTQFYDTLGLFSKQMKAEYTKRMRTNNPITWNDLDVINKEIHDKLDYIMTWSDEFKNESINKKNVVRLSESQLHNIIAESVNQILKEYGETPKGQYMLGRLAARQNARRGVGNLDSYNTSEAGKFARTKDPNGELGWHFNAGVGDQGDYEWQKNPQSTHYNGERENDIERAKRRINRGMEYHGLR